MAKFEDFLDHGKYRSITINVGFLIFVGLIVLLTVLAEVSGCVIK